MTQKEKAKLVPVSREPALLTERDADKSPVLECIDLGITFGGLKAVDNFNVTIGSGGVTGLGLGNSIEKQLWLPESTNDFIFSVVCEELGFVGAVIVILLFVLFLVQGLWLAFHAENRYCTLVGIGIMAQIAWQVFCNIAVVTNTLPNTGISLPFFSSGGTSLILLLAEMGVMINIGRGGERARLERENLRAQREQREKEKSDNTIRLDPNVGY